MIKRPAGGFGSEKVLEFAMTTKLTDSSLVFKPGFIQHSRVQHQQKNHHEPARFSPINRARHSTSDGGLFRIQIPVTVNFTGLSFPDQTV